MTGKTSSAYYDTCLFLNALNTTHREHSDCERATCPALINWKVVFCRELICSESTAEELLNAFEIGCALAGKLAINVALSDGMKIATRKQGEKRALRQLQLKSRDFSHLMCCVAAGADAIVTVDPNFWDARNKGLSRGSKKFQETKRYIEKHLCVRVMGPCELF